MNNENIIQAILFAGAESKSVNELATILNVKREKILEDLKSLAILLESSALMLVYDGENVSLATRPEYSEILEKIRNEEMTNELSKASSETLAIISYYKGVTKSQIEFIRGVNATYSIRSLLMRGLIEERMNDKKRGYYLSNEFLVHYGIENVESLPNYAEEHQKIVKLLTGEENEI